MRLRTLLPLLLLFLGPSCGDDSEVRVRNDSSVDFREVKVENRDYGDIPAGTATPYQSWEGATDVVYITLIAGETTLVVQPFDGLGAEKLGDGKFTHVLTIEDGYLIVRQEKD